MHILMRFLAGRERLYTAFCVGLPCEIGAVLLNLHLADLSRFRTGASLLLQYAVVTL